MNNRIKRRLVSHGQLNKVVNTVNLQMNSLVTQPVAGILFNALSDFNSNVLQPLDNFMVHIPLGGKGNFNGDFNTYEWEFAIYPTLELQTDTYVFNFGLYSQYNTNWDIFWNMATGSIGKHVFKMSIASKVPGYVVVNFFMDGNLVASGTPNILASNFNNPIYSLSISVQNTGDRENTIKIPYNILKFYESYVSNT